MLLNLILVLFFLSLFISLCHWFGRDARLMRQIPGPRAWPIIGNSMYYMLPPEKLFQFMRSIHKEYGPINQIHAINVRMVNVSNPDDMEILLSSSEYSYKGYPYTFLVPWLGDGLATSNGTKWHQRRKLVTKAFHFNILKRFMVTFKEGTEDLIKQIEDETAKAQTDLSALLGPAMLQVLCETAMGISLREDKVMFSTYLNSIKAVSECIVIRLSKVWLHNDFIFNLSKVAKMQKVLLEHLHRFTNKVIQDRRKLLEDTNFNIVDDKHVTYHNNAKMALLDLLLQHERNEMIDNEGIREEVDTFMLAGHDAVTQGLKFFLMAIANEPAIQDKIYEELEGVFGSSQQSPTIEELNRLKYLECCIKETLRLYTVIPMVIKRLLKDTVLSGYTVPAGSTCFLFLYDLHHRADLYPDPDRFDPDRFLPENSEKRHPYAYIPFSAGFRNCIGQKFAMLEMKTVLTGLLRKFRLEAVTKPSELIFKTDIALRTKDPIYVRFRYRS